MAGVVAGTSVTDVFTAASGQGATADQVALAGTRTKSGDTCRPVDCTAGAARGPGGTGPVLPAEVP
ncbi:hypothetical protein GCM10010421_09780 [Streptomyces glaucus]|uniref:Secreted protein n=1 Tax=Streptomyces glaucus TaxID=284029 RepID=A0ABN3J9B3_9ACTN